MRKLVILVKILLCAAVLNVSCAYADTNKSKRFDFKEHTQEFIEGKALNIKCLLDENEPVKHWVIQFKDGCAVKFITDLDDNHSRCWRWDIRKGHGKQV